ncbi:hypothetical protein [Robiginitalea sp. SC105]|uniref:hypothetical protein n=1 Tax=Robiginitalea sp. SC105 TaxID=2762332 RepID=UPI00163A8CE8|nr:hypothetical protein [Robiginitalea sp. SC105]MBC2838876.1 hypothetical protein [Robiginitalea sp. SC105]
MDGFMDGANDVPMGGNWGFDYGNEQERAPTFSGFDAEHDFFCETSEIANENWLPGDVGVYFDSAKNEFTVSLIQSDGELYETHQKNVFYDTDGRTGTYEIIGISPISRTYRMVYTIDGKEQVDIVIGEHVPAQNASYNKWIVPVNCRDQDGISLWSEVWTQYQSF